MFICCSVVTRRELALQYWSVASNSLEAERCDVTGVYLKQCVYFKQLSEANAGASARKKMHSHTPLSTFQRQPMMIELDALTSLWLSISFDFGYGQN